jgi:hypothetical protein
MEECVSLTHRDLRFYLFARGALVEPPDLDDRQGTTWYPPVDISGMIGMEKSSYYLSRHTFFCLADNHYVFLDLQSDEYLCLGRKHTDALRVLLKGDRSGDMRATHICLHDTGDLDASAAIQALLKKGLIVENDAYGKSPIPARVAAPSTSTMDGIYKPKPRISLAHIWRFFAAAATADKNLRWESIERTVRTVEHRKSTHTTAADSIDISTISDLFEIFHTLRPYYPRKYLCLFDSLALLHFLARYRVFPQWVYGVRLEPFAAHCWVQAGDAVVNDIIDNVRDYTPIMSI